MKRLMILIAVVLLGAGPATAAIDSQSNGQDGALNVTSSLEIDLGLAATGPWDTQPSGFVPGNGVYDPDKWAVFFHYTDVTIAAGATVTFKNHPNNPPVVWLVQGKADILGTVKLDGTAGGLNTAEASGGPGGFRGGRSAPNAGYGMGPGGGQLNYGGSYGSLAPNTTGPTYGNPLILPLIGGSGGGGNVRGGGGGGGALMIAAADSIRVAGAITAIGGGQYLGNTAGGSGGAIKLVSEVVAGTGNLFANGGQYNAGGNGRICILGNAVPFSGGSNPIYHSEPAGTNPQLWPDSATPIAIITEINGFAVPTDPKASLDYPWQDVLLSGGGTVTCTVTTTNVPTTATVTVYVVKSRGTRLAGAATLVGGNETLATWTATVANVGNGMYSVMARAVLP